MPINPRNKGQFVQAGSLHIFPAPRGAVVSHDGTLALDSVHLQADYPELFAVLGIQYNDGGKGDDDATQFRTPNETTLGLPTLGDAEWRIRF